jgi:hypothetical protein
MPACGCCSVDSRPGGGLEKVKGATTVSSRHERKVLADLDRTFHRDDPRWSRRFVPRRRQRQKFLDTGIGVFAVLAASGLLVGSLDLVLVSISALLVLADARYRR